MHEKELLTELHLVDNEDARRDLAQMDNKYVGLFRYLATTCRYPTYYGKDVTYFSTGEEAIEALFADLEKAEKFIFMEYFIVHEGKVMDQLLDILSRKAAEGVEVRFMYDGLCGLKLPKHYAERISELGIQCCVSRRSGRSCRRTRTTATTARSPSSMVRWATQVGSSRREYA